jgi:hypothetical protein
VRTASSAGFLQVIFVLRTAHSLERARSYRLLREYGEPRNLSPHKINFFTKDPG